MEHGEGVTSMKCGRQMPIGTFQVLVLVTKSTTFPAYSWTQSCMMVVIQEFDEAENEKIGKTDVC